MSSCKICLVLTFSVVLFLGTLMLIKVHTTQKEWSRETMLRCLLRSYLENCVESKCFTQTFDSVYSFFLKKKKRICYILVILSEWNELTTVRIWVYLNYFNNNHHFKKLFRCLVLYNSYWFKNKINSTNIMVLCF